MNKKSQTFFNVGTLFIFLLPSFIFFYTQNTKFANVFDVAIIIISIIISNNEIEDVLFGLNTLNNYNRIFGGNPVQKDINGKSLYTFKMNITRHFQNAQKARKPMDLLISPLFKKESAARAVLFGPGHSQYPAKLILTFSE